MSNYVQLGDVHTSYEEDGAGEPLVLLHPGLADSRAFEDYVPELAKHFHVFRPDRRGHGRTPDRDRPRRRDDRLRHRLRGRRRPDGPDHFPAVKAKLDRMHREEPTLGVADLAGYPGPALVMVGDGDEEIPIDHTLALHRGLPNAQLAVLPGGSSPPRPT